MISFWNGRPICFSWLPWCKGVVLCCYDDCESIKEFSVVQFILNAIYFPFYPIIQVSAGSVYITDDTNTAGLIRQKRAAGVPMVWWNGQDFFLQEAVLQIAWQGRAIYENMGPLYSSVLIHLRVAPFSFIIVFTINHPTLLCTTLYKCQTVSIGLPLCVRFVLQMSVLALRYGMHGYVLFLLKNNKKWITKKNMVNKLHEFHKKNCCSGRRITCTSVLCHGNVVLSILWQVHGLSSIFAISMFSPVFSLMVSISPVFCVMLLSVLVWPVQSCFLI